MRKTSLQNAFIEGNAIPPTQGSAKKIISARDAVDWLQNQFDFEKSVLERSALHDFVGHVLSGGTSGLVIDEIRAAISEYYILGVPTHKRYSAFNEGKILTLPESFNDNLEQLCALYEMAGREFSLIQIQIEKDRIQKTVTGFHEVRTERNLSPEQIDKIRTLISKDKKIASLKERSRENELTAAEFEQSCARAQTIDIFFRNNHQGRKVSDFKVSEIMAMPLAEFGIEAVEWEGKLQFLPFIEHPHPLLVAGTLPGFLAHGFSL